MQLIYDSLQLDEKVFLWTFNYAINGFEKLDEEGALGNDSILTIIDFDQPSYKKRMYIIDVRNYKILFNTWVAHGKNTGKELAESFSNVNESNKSSLGFYVTDVTYNGSKGYSLKLIGLEGGLNNNALRRAIVVHGAPYVSESFIHAQGYIGRSHGCPAVPQELSKPIIQTIKNGSCLLFTTKYIPISDGMILLFFLKPALAGFNSYTIRNKKKNLCSIYFTTSLPDENKYYLVVAHKLFWGIVMPRI